MNRCILSFMLVLVFGVCQCRAESRGEIESILARRASGQELTTDEYNRMQDIVTGFTDAQLISVLHTGRADSVRDLCRTEIATRSLIHPHWTIVPEFWLFVGTVILSVGALALAWRAELRALRSERAIALLSASRLPVPQPEQAVAGATETLDSQPPETAKES